jgi:short-subunit dehydrogenase
MAKTSPKTVLITGASSGIGGALALRFAAPGVTVALSGRDQARLEAVAGECRQHGAEVTTRQIDTRDRTGMAGWIGEVDRATPIDLVVANAGVMSGTPPLGLVEASDAAYNLIETNVLGVLNTVQPLLVPMMERRRGQIAIVSSLAAFVALPDSPSYCASKSAVLSYGLALRALLAKHGVDVSVICPGYITTPMSARENVNKPQEMPAEKAAEIIVRGLARNRAVIAFPRTLALLTQLNALLPDRLRRMFLPRFTVSD